MSGFQKQFTDWLGRSENERQAWIRVIPFMEEINNLGFSYVPFFGMCQVNIYVQDASITGLLIKAGATFKKKSFNEFCGSFMYIYDLFGIRFSVVASTSMCKVELQDKFIEAHTEKRYVPIGDCDPLFADVGGDTNEKAAE